MDGGKTENWREVPQLCARMKCREPRSFFLSCYVADLKSLYQYARLKSRDGLRTYFTHFGCVLGFPSFFMVFFFF